MRHALYLGGLAGGDPPWRHRRARSNVDRGAALPPAGADPCAVLAAHRSVSEAAVACAVRPVLRGPAVLHRRGRRVSADIGGQHRRCRKRRHPGIGCDHQLVCLRNPGAKATPDRPGPDRHCDPDRWQLRNSGRRPVCLAWPVAVRLIERRFCRLHRRLSVRAHDGDAGHRDHCRVVADHRDAIWPVRRDQRRAARALWRNRASNSAAGRSVRHGGFPHLQHRHQTPGSKPRGDAGRAGATALDCGGLFCARRGAGCAGADRAGFHDGGRRTGEPGGPAGGQTGINVPISCRTPAGSPARHRRSRHTRRCDTCVRRRRETASPPTTSPTPALGR